MKCSHCGHEIKNPVTQAGGRVGGLARVSKGFASPEVMRKAIATRKQNREAKQKEQSK